jgi:hypothetical protein
MIGLTAIKIYNEGQWHDTSKRNERGGTMVLINPIHVACVAQVFMLNGDPACTLTMVDGTQIMVNQDILVTWDDLSKE